MEIVRRINSMREITRKIRARGKKIGFVPTMGSLHDGHLSLVHHVRAMTDVVVVSIFVNPTQFGAGEDFDSYPRELTRDADMLIAENVDYLFAPEANEIYPPGPSTFVEVADLSTRLEGACRPGHFRGVATVVLKLFEIVRPTVAAFGQKDAQQAVIIRRMVRDLMLDTEIQVLPIQRDEDGVALSSRNRNLSSDERRAARAIPRSLDAATEAVSSGETDPDKVVGTVRDILEEEPLLRVEYVELVDPELLQPLTEIGGKMLLVVAVFAGSTRLIDNVIIES